MFKIYAIAISILVACVALVTRAQTIEIPTNLQQRFEFREIHMGVAARLVLYARNETDAQNAARAAFARVAELEQIASDYRADSEVRLASRHFDRPNAAQLRISADLFAMLSLSRRVAHASNGLFDPTISPLVTLWRRARQTQKLPSQNEIRAAKKLVGWRKMKLNQRAQTLQLQPGMRLDLGGVAKGYACDKALQVLAAHKIRSAMIELGGDIAVGAPPPQQTGWHIEAPDNRVWILKNCAISTSGDSVQWLEIGGVRYSHLVDVRSGLGRTDHYSATVIAPNATLSDALSSAAGLMGTKKAQKLKREFPVLRLQVLAGY